MPSPRTSNKQNNPRKRPKSKSITRRASFSFSGPLPHPEILAQYEAASRGAANRIISMAENQARHRQQMENAVVNSNIRNERVGMYFAFVITVALMAIGAFLIQQGRDVAGYLSFFGPAVFHAANYVFHRVETEKNQREKQAEFDQSVDHSKSTS